MKTKGQIKEFVRNNFELSRLTSSKQNSGPFGKTLIQGKAIIVIPPKLDLIKSEKNFSFIAVEKFTSKGQLESYVSVTLTPTFKIYWRR
jgi:hypothetical protein